MVAYTTQPIPMLRERWGNLREVGRVLLEVHAFLNRPTLTRRSGSEASLPRVCGSAITAARCGGS